MIIVNGKQLDLSNGKTKLEKSIIDGIREIRDKKDLVVIKDPRPWKYDDKGKRLIPQTNAFKLTTSRLNDNGVSEIWVYSTRTKLNRKTGITEYVPAQYIMAGEDYLNPVKDAERIYFLTAVMDVTKFGLIIEDKEKDAQIQLAREAEEGDVAMYVKSNRSPLSVDQLRLLGLSWGMSDADTVPESILRINLFKLISDGNKKSGRGYKAFLQDVDNLLRDDQGEVRLRATVEMAVKNKVVTWDEKRLKMVWGGTDRVICAVPPSKMMSKKEYLFIHFNTHKNDREILYTSMDGVADEMPVLGFEDLKKIGNLLTLKAKAKEIYGIDVKPEATKEETLQLVEEEIKRL